MQYFQDQNTYPNVNLPSSLKNKQKIILTNSVFFHENPSWLFPYIYNTASIFPKHPDYTDTHITHTRTHIYLHVYILFFLTVFSVVMQIFCVRIMKYSTFGKREKITIFCELLCKRRVYYIQILALLKALKLENYFVYFQKNLTGYIT